MRNRAFTLIELLAVIVILGIILAIAIPTISGLINNTTKNAFEADTKMVLKAIEYKKLEDEDFDVTTIDESNIEGLLKLDDANYQSITVELAGTAANITIVGKNKWDGLIAHGTIKNIVVDSLEDYVIDEIPPIITITGDNPISIVKGNQYNDAGATAQDDVDGDITDSIIVTMGVDINVVGTYFVVYTVEDSAGNNATPVVRTVRVLENTGPTITFGTNGNESYTKTASTTVTVTDLDSGLDVDSLKYQWTTSVNAPSEESFVNTFTNGDTINTPDLVTGEYYLWVIAKDTLGNTNIASTSAFNLDNTIPVITMTGSSTISIEKGTSYNDLGAVATDNIDGNITGNILVTSTVNPNVVGTYTVTYNVSDSSGNNATPVIRTVKVYTYSSDLCSGGTPIASVSSGPASRAFDDLASTTEYYWYSRYSGSQMVGYDYVGYTFSTTRIIRKVRVYTIAYQNHAISNVKLQALVGGVWTDVQILYLSVTDGWQEFNVGSPISSQSWRILANSYIDNYWYVGEIEMKEMVY